MSESNSRKPVDALDSQLASELEQAMLGVAVGEQFKVSPSDSICYSLELYIPRLLRSHYSGWRTESLDGIFVIRAVKKSLGAAQFVGTSILISDQTVTPFMLDIELSASGNSIDIVRLMLGELGGGRLGISGPPCNSRESRQLLISLVDRLDSVAWVFSVESGEGR
jgi:hypothetical protein